MIAIDTNVLVRYFTQDNAQQAKAAAVLIEDTLTAQRSGFISTIVLCELLWVLRKFYAVDRAAAANIIETVLAVDALTVECRDAVARAVLDFRAAQADFADCLMFELAQEQGCTEFVTFDKAFARRAGVRLLA
ncbi:MAG: type II toxin-antitoxin system VapC family toxin [Hyphomonadaceae bacterium]|nr:type II toxin-antitoxin system VapC family toxin [Hyphomonadaceae bacterium]